MARGGGPPPNVRGGAKAPAQTAKKPEAGKGVGKAAQDTVKGGREKARAQRGDNSALDDTVAEIEAAEHHAAKAAPPPPAPPPPAKAAPVPPSRPPAREATDRQKDVQERNKMLELQAKAAAAEKEKAALAEKVQKLEAQLKQQPKKAGRGKPNPDKPKPTNGQRRQKKGEDQFNATNNLNL